MDGEGGGDRDELRSGVVSYGAGGDGSSVQNDELSRNGLGDGIELMKSSELGIHEVAPESSIA